MEGLCEEGKGEQLFNQQGERPLFDFTSISLGSDLIPNKISFGLVSIAVARLLWRRRKCL